MPHNIPRYERYSRCKTPMQKTNRIKITPDVQYSKEYTGEWDITWCSVDDMFESSPTSIHVIWTAIGF